MRFLVQRAIFSLSFYFFKNCIFLPFVQFYTKRLYLFSSFYSVKDYTFLLSLFAFQKNCMFSLSVPFRRRLYVSFLYSVSSKNYSVPFSFILSKGYPLLLSSREPKRFAVCIPPHFLRPPALFPVPKPSIPLFKLSSAALSRRSRVFLPILDSSVSMRRGARGASLLRPLVSLRIRSRFPRRELSFPPFFPFPAPVVSRLNVPAPIKNRAGA